jgi:hypothetical protein
VAFAVLFFAALVVSGTLQCFITRAWLAFLIPFILFVAFVLIDAYVLPYRGGGASMWPIAIMFGGPTVLAGSGVAVLIAVQFRKKLAARKGAI